MQEQIDTSPDQSSHGRGRRENSSKNGNNGRVQDESAQDSCQGRSEDHAECRTPQLLRAGCDFLPEKSKRRSEKEPGDGQWKEESRHTWQKGQIGFTVCGEADDRNEGNREQVAKDQNALVHEGPQGVQRVETLDSIILL